jgi:hypothetical protein
VEAKDEGLGHGNEISMQCFCIHLKANRPMPSRKPTSVSQPDAVSIARKITVLRGQKVLLDSDLASLYGVETRRLNEQVRRNVSRFPPGFHASADRRRIC